LYKQVLETSKTGKQWKSDVCCGATKAEYFTEIAK
jgi:hypothetical protein